MQLKAKEVVLCSFLSLSCLYLFTVFTWSMTNDLPRHARLMLRRAALCTGMFHTDMALTTHSRSMNATSLWPSPPLI
jgi:hypothetical protein